MCAIEEMRDTKDAWRKTGGRQYKHFIQSFPYDEDITPEEAFDIAGELIRRSPLFKGYEVCYATHIDKGHIHTHWIVNSVSFEHGYKFRYSKRMLQELKDFSDKILKARQERLRKGALRYLLPYQSIQGFGKSRAGHIP